MATTTDTPTFPHLTKTTHTTQYPAIAPTNPANSASNKTILITGGGSGIGGNIASAFAAAGAATLILLGRRASALDKKATELLAEFPALHVLIYSVDITDEARVQDVFTDARKVVKDIDVLVLNAAYIEQGKQTLAYSAEQINATFATNFTGNLNLVRAFLHTDKTPVSATKPETMQEKVIIDISTSATYLPYSGSSLYAASKLAFSNTLLGSIQVEHPEIRCHSFHPGVIFTEASAAGGMSKESYPFDDVSLPAGFAVWLASGQAAFLRGRWVMAAWDVEEMRGMEERFAADARLGTFVVKV